MNVSIIVPVPPEAPELRECLRGILAQDYRAGHIEVIVAGYGGAGLPETESLPPSSPELRWIAVDHPSPYAARNLAAAQSNGEALLFTESGCVPEPGWASAHVARLERSPAAISVGRISPARATRAVDLFRSYEDLRDAWVFSCDGWRFYFGRPKNMAIGRELFESHGPFAEVLRGADSSLVQKIARELCCDRISLTPDAVVRQLSVSGLGSFLHDRFGHARGLEKYQSAHAAPIPLETRVGIFRETVRQHGYGPLSAGALLLLLTVGVAVFRIGGATGAFARRSQA